MRHPLRLAATLALLQAACGGGGPGAPDPREPADTLSEREQTEHMLFHFSPGDGVDAARQEAHYAWVVDQLHVELPGTLLYFKYRNRGQMAALTGRSANGFAEPERLEVHSIFTWHSHEAVHVYSSLVGRPSDFFNEGLAVAWSVDPLAGRFDGTYSGEPVHDWARRRPDLLLPIEDIVTTERFRQVEESLGYQEAGSFVEYLVDSQGTDPVVDFLRRGHREDTLDTIRASFVASFGFTLSDAEARWRAFLDADA
jgi:hypothetical protein